MSCFRDFQICEQDWFSNPCSGLDEAMCKESNCIWNVKLNQCQSTPIEDFQEEGKVIAAQTCNENDPDPNVCEQKNGIWVPRIFKHDRCAQFGFHDCEQYHCNYNEEDCNTATTCEWVKDNACQGKKKEACVDECNWDNNEEKCIHKGRCRSKVVCEWREPSIGDIPKKYHSIWDETKWDSDSVCETSYSACNSLKKVLKETYGSCRTKTDTFDECGTRTEIDACVVDGKCRWVINDDGKSYQCIGAYRYQRDDVEEPLDNVSPSRFLQMCIRDQPESDVTDMGYTWTGIINGDDQKNKPSLKKMVNQYYSEELKYNNKGGNNKGNKKYNNKKKKGKARRIKR